jgi:hypothetical protein
MAKIKNTTGQPIYLNLTRGNTMKIRARATVELREEDLHSAEMIFHQSRGHVVVLDRPKGPPTKVAEGDESAETGEEAESEPESELAGESRKPEGAPKPPAERKERKRGRKGGR